MSDAPIGEVLSQLVDDGKRYARAEIALYKAKAIDKAQPLKGAAVLASIAAVLALAAVTALLVGIILALADVAGPLWATIIVVLASLGLAGLLGFIAWQRLKDVAR